MKHKNYYDVLDLSQDLKETPLLTSGGCRHFFLKSQEQAIITSSTFENTKIRKSMPNYELKITKVLSALLVSATHS